jgi:hypothetical protein
VIEQRIHMSQIPALAGVAAARAVVRVRKAALAAGNGFCTAVFVSSIPTPDRRPPIE